MNQDPAFPEAEASATPLGGLAALAQSVILAWGWRRRLIAFVGGALGALALPPLDWTPAMIAPLALAVWLIDGSVAGRAKRGIGWASLLAAFGVGWWWGFGYFIAGLWWLGAAFFVDAGKFVWALPFGVIGLPAALALFPALGFALARLLWRADATRVLALAIGLGASEWLRCVALTGFPWNDLGMALGANLELAQIASLVGLHGLTLATVAIFAAPATLATETRRRWAPSLLALAAFAAIFGYGVWRVRAPPSPTVAGVKLRLMQPNLSQDSDFTPQNGEAILHEYLALSDRATSPTTSGVADVTHLIWPESAFPFLLARDGDALAAIAEFLRGGATLITGAARLDDNDHSDNRRHFYNSILTLNRQGLLPERYDKHHLVPFGEYLPFGRLLTRIGLTQFVHMPGGFDPGVGSDHLHVAGLPTAKALICYEAIFPNERRERGGDDPDPPAWLLNVTDDAWFGLTSGPYQHFAQARLRAIETGLPLARAANTGISAVIDGRGRILAEAPLGVEAVIDSALPQPLPPTWQSRWGSTSAGAIGLLMLIIVAIRRRRR
ncbi:MAG: apolipoprotein N-acyltransferase [Bradyrhizobium sp.]|nr:MAG: apolipoprotein N-acyltransferase [Bradyrhizobium sp.]